ncbi:protein of unknown function [Methylocella tundrae]|uniref:Uncharacterized protein n=1 Tax=Methylocella tundrae TaxID=227605 RepID=A0A4U8Z0A1_METTU|nr:protein of unknown function [Methylocella tundrae]
MGRTKREVGGSPPVAAVRQNGVGRGHPKLAGAALGWFTLGSHFGLPFLGNVIKPLLSLEFAKETSRR